MDAIPATRKGKGLSFSLDREALSCLLYEIIDLCAKSNGVVHIEMIQKTVKDLGYRGPVATVGKLLTSRGFMSEIAGEKTFCMRDENRAAIENFFRKHQKAFLSQNLDDVDKKHLFQTLGKGGSYAEDLLLRVMRMLSTLLTELESVPKVELQTLFMIAGYEAVQCALGERLPFHKERFEDMCQKLDCAHEAVGIHSKEFQKIHREYVRRYARLDAVVDDSIKNNDALKRTLRDIDIVDMLKTLRVVFRQLNTLLLDREEKLL